ncbi:MAG: 3-hydroxybutyryl-CoA dehydrogenase [Bacteroidetes bacterium]|nr:MAG: 3-hydroxybutyryl-CoA dehydrogenase [Bacteroidota bacterium]
MSDPIDSSATLGIVGAGTMGTGIAQIAAANGHQVHLYDAYPEQLATSEAGLRQILAKQVEKGRMTQQQMDTLLGRINWTDHTLSFSKCSLVIEAIVENLDIKKDQFARLEAIVPKDCILATNTSSLSIASISSALKRPDRFLGIHFFNPAPLMKLVEIIPGIATSTETVQKARTQIDAWGKVTVLAKDTPGFIVNRVARPFYGEALRIYEEGIADAPTIDWAMKTIGGFRMGPFELMDLIGHDVNYAVTETVFRNFYYDPRFRPSFTQKRLVEAGWLGRKSGRGFYDYPTENPPEPLTDEGLGREIFERILAMLINEAFDAVFMNIASRKEVDLAMLFGVNYPKGLIDWAEEWGFAQVLARLEHLNALYGEDRYRVNPLLRRVVHNGDSV